MTQLKDLRPEFPDLSGMWLVRKIPNTYFDLSVISCVKDLSDMLLNISKLKFNLLSVEL